MPVNQWVHVAWCYDGVNVRLYQNGVLTLTMAANNGFDPTTSASDASIGSILNGDPSNNTESFLGDIAGFRISNSVRYSGSSFTPPTTPFTADASTLFLIDPSSFSSTPTTFSAPGTQGITGTLGGKGGTSPTWVSYTGWSSDSALTAKATLAEAL